MRNGSSRDTGVLIRRGVALVALSALAAGLGGCRGERSDATPHQFLPDMDDSPKWKPQSESDFFADGRTMRPRLAGTVAFGETSGVDDDDRAAYLKASPEFYFGRDEDGDFLTYIPGSLDVDESVIAFGAERFGIYCAICHGYQGEGGILPTKGADGSGGMVGRRWAYAVPSFHDEKYTDRAQRTGKDGYIFDVIRYGKWDDQVAHSGSQKMPAYAHALDEHEAWSVVAYLRVLQASRRAADSLPESEHPANRPAQETADAVSMAQETRK